jgi:hypothetical protein
MNMIKAQIAIAKPKTPIMAKRKAMAMMAAASAKHPFLTEFEKLIVDFLQHQCLHTPSSQDAAR